MPSDIKSGYDAEWQARFGDDPPPGDLPDIPWLRQVLLRRTQRRYDARPVPEPLLQLLLGAAFSASSKSDFQQVSVVRVADRDRRDRLAALVPDMPWVGAAPVFLVFCGDARRLERLGELRGQRVENGRVENGRVENGRVENGRVENGRVENGRLEGFFNAAVDAALAMQTFTLAAETAGLGCCPISALRNHAAAVAEILELPDKVFPVAGLSLGYPAAEGYISLRLPLAVGLHTDRYDDSGLAAAIDAYDHRRDARFSIPRERRRAPETFGDAAFYGWSEDKARQAAADPEGQAFPAWLRSRGFTFD